MSQDTDRKVNPFPPHWIGLWRVKAVPYYYKDQVVRDRWLVVKRSLIRERVTS